MQEAVDRRLLPVFEAMSKKMTEVRLGNAHKGGVTFQRKFYEPIFQSFLLVQSSFPQKNILGAYGGCELL